MFCIGCIQVRRVPVESTPFENVSSLLNFFAVEYYGESEFWLAIGKTILITGLIVFTFVTMVGGNPLHDPYGFRYWNCKLFMWPTIVH